MRKLVIKVECYCLIVLFNEKYTQVYINHVNLTRNFIELKKKLHEEDIYSWYTCVTNIYLKSLI